MENFNVKQLVSITDRKIIEADGVKNIITFTDDYVEIDTALGIMCIEGENLRIEELSKDKTKLTVSGNINGIFYRETKNIKKFFSKNKK